VFEQGALRSTRHGTLTLTPQPIVSNPSCVSPGLQAFRNVRDGLYFQFRQWITDQLPRDEQKQLDRVGENDS
jgi:hypothetical protein